jgi:hypothetical protein
MEERRGEEVNVKGEKKEKRKGKGREERGEEEGKTEEGRGKKLKWEI